MFKKPSLAVRLIGAVMMIASLSAVPALVRAQHRLPHHDLGHHDPVPQRLRYNWNGEAQAKAKPLPPDDRKTSPASPEPVALSETVRTPAYSRSTDERVPCVALDRSPLLFRGPPASLLS
jgi:hypothetical protein